MEAAEAGFLLFKQHEKDTYDQMLSDERVLTQELDSLLVRFDGWEKESGETEGTAGSGSAGEGKGSKRRRDGGRRQ